MIEAILFISGWVATGIVIGWFSHTFVKRRRLLKLQQSLIKQAQSSENRDAAKAYEDAADDVWREAIQN